MTLTAEQILHYRDEGYVVLPALIQGQVLERSMEVFHQLVDASRSMDASQGAYNLAPGADGQPIPGRLHKVQGVCVADPRVLDLAREPAIVDCIEDLIGPDIDAFGTKFFPMLGGGSTSTRWHQDNYYFGTNSDRVVSCAIYLEATDRESGCLQVVPRSHLGGAIVSHAAGQGAEAHGAWVDVDPSLAVDVVCPAGTVVLFSANLLHGALPNVSDRTSYRTAWHYIPGDLDLDQFPRGVYADLHTVRRAGSG